jgi:hypothetical protein
MEEVSSFCSRFPSCSKAKVLTFRSRWVENTFRET